MARNAEEAITLAETTHTWRAGWCLNFVRTMFGLPADTDDDNHDGIIDGLYAYQQWRSVPTNHKHATSDPLTVPRGACVFFTTSAHTMGHVAIGLGGGLCRGTWGNQVLTHDIAYILSHGYRLLGWTDWLSDHQINGLTYPEEDLMAKLPTIDLRNAATKYVNGVAVGRLQGLLMANGLGPAGLINRQGLPDKSGGPKTKAHLGAFQKKAGLPVTYVCDMGTWAKLHGI